MIVFEIGMIVFITKRFKFLSIIEIVGFWSRIICFSFTVMLEFDISWEPLVLLNDLLKKR